jgi:hypothetical protein
MAFSVYSRHYLHNILQYLSPSTAIGSPFLGSTLRVAFSLADVSLCCALLTLRLFVSPSLADGSPSGHVDALLLSLSGMVRLSHHVTTGLFHWAALCPHVSMDFIRVFSRVEADVGFCHHFDLILRSYFTRLGEC